MAIAQCKICNKDYEVCHTCANQRTFKPWRTVTDSIEHYKIYFAIHGYSITKNKEQAKTELQKCDLSDLENFKPNIKAVIKEIMAEPKKNNKTFKTINKGNVDAKSYDNVLEEKNDVE